MNSQWYVAFQFLCSMWFHPYNLFTYSFMWQRFIGHQCSSILWVANPHKEWPLLSHLNHWKQFQHGGILDNRGAMGTHESRNRGLNSEERQWDIHRVFPGGDGFEEHRVLCFRRRQKEQTREKRNIHQSQSLSVRSESGQKVFNRMCWGLFSKQ